MPPSGADLDPAHARPGVILAPGDVDLQNTVLEPRLDGIDIGVPGQAEDTAKLSVGPLHTMIARVIFLGLLGKH